MSTTTKTTTKLMEQALAADLERVNSIELRVSILNGDDFALSLPRDAPVSELRARVAQAMEAKNPERVRLFHANGEAELTQGNACCTTSIVAALCCSPQHENAALIPFDQLTTPLL